MKLGTAAETPLSSKEKELIRSLYTDSMDHKKRIASEAEERKKKEIEEVRRVRHYGNRPASAPRRKGLATPAAVKAAVEAAQPDERLCFYFVCPADLTEKRQLDVRLPDGREFTLQVPKEYQAGDEFAAVFPPLEPEVPKSAAEMEAERSKKVQTMADIRAATKRRKALEASSDPKTKAAAIIQRRNRLKKAARLREKRAQATADALERQKKAGRLIVRFIRRQKFRKTAEQIGRAMKQRSTALGRVAKTKEIPRVP